MPLRTLTIQNYNDQSGVALNAFQNSLFDPWPGPFASQPGQLFRTQLLQRIKQAEVNGQELPPGEWLVDPETSELLTAILLGYWLDSNQTRAIPARVIASDRAFVHLVRDYVEAYRLEMLIPVFTCAHKVTDGPSQYRLSGHRRYRFRDGQREESAWTFLTLLLLGAHFVVVHSAADLGVRNPSFFDRFKRLQGTGNAGHSHYTGHKVSLFGQNYPTLTLNQTEGANLDELTNPANAVLLPVVLCDETSNAKPNSFFQMEGWRPGKKMFGLSKPEYRSPALAGGYRHGADFNTHGKTIWNISTYGASPYSEKRGGQIMLAPAAWIDKPHLRTYRGFGGKGAGHAWFSEDLIDAS